MRNHVLVSFALFGYRPTHGRARRRPDAGPRRRPPRVHRLRADGRCRLAKAQSAEVMASIVAERLIARLERDGFVVMRRPGLGGHAALGRGFEPRSG
jgi:hypothetical protein